MGEIATWSAVKTKVGLGKDSNECPTKAELLALSPTGTGENYVGLEISNASSYGNNETVQLSDIHKVTYRYAFTVVDTVLNFPALGGYPTPRWFGLGTTKQKQIDGVAIGDTISVGYTKSAYPDWVVYDEGYKASKNTTLNQRSASFTFTQNESGKQITVQFTQDAGVETWEYTFSVQNPNLNYTALGGSATPAIAGYNSFKQRYINGKPVGTRVDVGFSSPDLPSWIFMDDENHYTALENKSENSRSQVFTSTQNESGKKVTVTFAQLAGVKTYGTPTVYLGSIADIPASGGTAATPTYTYSQLWGWNGKTNDGGTISSGASVVWSENISGSNLGTTAKARTKLGSRTLTVTLNGKSGSASIDVYQAENKITNVTQGAWVVSISANPSTLTEMGGTSQISASARASRTNHWSSGATNAASDATGTPTLSIPTAVTGFSLSGTTLTVAENKTANQRSVVVRATMGTVYKEVTVTQSAYLVEWKYTFSITPLTLNFDALGAEQQLTITSYREKYINGSIVSGSRENVEVTETKDSFINTYITTGKCTVSMDENTVASSRVGHINFFQTGSDQAAIEVTCNQSAAIISESWVLREISGFGTIPAVGGQVYAIVESGYYDVINGTQGTWHNEAPEVSNNPDWISLTSVQYNNDNTYTIKATGISNSDASGRSGKIFINNHPKSLGLDIVQSGASISYNYYFSLVSDFPSVAAAGATPMAKVLSKSKEVINGTESSSYGIPQITVQSKPDWVGNIEAKVCGHANAEETLDITAVVSENKTSSIRRGTIIIKQNNSHKTLTLNINQAAASITTRDYINYVEPIPDGMFSALAQSITVTLQSYRETLINDKVTSKVAVQPDFDLDSTVTDWASVDLIGGNLTNYEYDFEVSVKENTTNQTRSGNVMFYNGAAEVENAWAFTQDAATISTRYEISWTANYSNGTVEENVTEVELEGTTGMENSVRMDLHILEYTSINGVEGTPTSWDSRAIAENNSAIASPSGQVSATLQSDSENAFIGISNSVQNLSEYPRTHTITLYNPKVVINGKEVGTVPTITLLVNPVPYTRVFEFGWKQEGSTITNITLDGDIYGSSAGSRDIISYASLRRDGVEFAKKYIKPTLIPPSEDWLQVIDNGQNSDNSYNWAFRALTNNEGDSARNLQVRFEQPGNGNQSLYAYVSQDPMDEGYLWGRVNNNGPRAIRLNTVKDEQFLGNIDVQAGNFYGLGTLAQDAITIEVNISVAGTDSSTYTQQVELSNLRFSESGRPVTISNDPNQNTDYEYSWELYPNANVPASFTVNISMLSSDGDNDDGIRLNIIKKNTAVFPIGTLIGDLILTPKDPTKLPILLCTVYHRYFT